MLTNSKNGEGGNLNKAFTLIELLAVIVIIAVVALITIPIIINVVENAKRNALMDSAYGIIEAGSLYYMENMNKSELSSRTDFKVSGGKFVLETDTTKELKFTGKMPKTGLLQIHENGKEAIGICNDTYCACKSVSEIKVSIKEGNCNINSETGEIEKEQRIDATPIGTVISYMGKNTPEGYLSCDGKIYNINDYKDLAEQIKKEFGSYNYYGGDGMTTFAVPDLRGEFLRGTGTNGHANQGSGASVGIHQDGTEIPSVFTWGKSFGIYTTANSSSDFNNKAENYDSMVKQQKYYITAQSSYLSQEANYPSLYTSRPTNTSVLYCIKY